MMPRASTGMLRRYRRTAVRWRPVPAVHGGAEDGLSVAYSRVLGATSHTGLIELQRGRVNRRLPFWPMRWLPTQPEQLKSLARADWSGFAQRTGDDAPTETAMDVLARLVEPYAVAA